MTSKHRALALAAVLAIAAVVAAIAYARAAGNTDREVTARTVSVRGCLLGGALAPGENSRARLLQVELGQPPADDPAEGSDRWPERCDAAAQRLVRSLRQGPPGYVRGARARLLATTESLFAPPDGPERPVIALATRLDAWERYIVDAGLPAPDREAESEPGFASFRRPQLAAPLPLVPVELGYGALPGAGGSLLRGPDPTRVIVAVDESPPLARIVEVKGEPFAPFSASAGAKMLLFPKATKAGLSLVDSRGTTVWPGPGIVFAHAGNGRSTYVACNDDDGCRVNVIAPRGEGYELLRSAALPRDQTHALVNGLLVSRAKSDDPETLFVSWPDRSLSPRSPLSPKLEPWLRLRVCRAEDHAVLAVQGPARTVFYFFDGAAWSEGVAAKAPDFDSLSGAGAQLGCDEHGASIASREGDGLALLRCTSEGCRRAVTRPLPGIRDLAFAGVGDSLLTARLVDGAGDYRAVRSVWFRFGAPETLHAIESLLIGDEPHGGHGVGRLMAAPIGNGALLTLSALGSATRGTYVVLFGRGGRPERVLLDGSPSEHPGETP